MLLLHPFSVIAWGYSIFLKDCWHNFYCSHLP
jgi:hypothetical protein